MTETPDWHRDWMPELRTAPPWVMQEMIEAQPDLARAIAALDVAPVAALVRAAPRAGAPIVVTGCGTSEHAAQGIAEMISDMLGATAHVEACQAFEAALDPRPGGVCIGVTHDGGTGATIAALRAAAEAGATTVVITAKPDAQAAQTAAHVLVTPLRDRSWCHTVGYLSPLVTGAAIAAAVDGESLATAGAGAAVSAGIEVREEAVAVAHALHGTRQIIVTGSGADRIAARELALKIEEGVRTPSIARDLETVLHGHFAALDETTGLVLIAADSSRARRTRRARRRAPPRKQAHRRPVRGDPLARVRLGDGKSDLTDAGRVVVKLDERLAAPAAALLATAGPLQLLTLELAHLAGCNPDLIGRDREAWREAAALVES